MAALAALAALAAVQPWLWAGGCHSKCSDWTHPSSTQLEDLHSIALPLTWLYKTISYRENKRYYITYLTFQSIPVTPSHFHPPCHSFTQPFHKPPHESYQFHPTIALSPPPPFSSTTTTHHANDHPSNRTCPLPHLTHAQNTSSLPPLHPPCPLHLTARFTPCYLPASLRTHISPLSDSRLLNGITKHTLTRTQRVAYACHCLFCAPIHSSHAFHLLRTGISHLPTVVTYASQDTLQKYPACCITPS